jgi:hypothetical protein
MISKDESIVTQVAAKIASELTSISSDGGSVEDVQATYLSHFDFVRELLVGAHGFDEAPKQAPATQRAVDNVVSEFGASYESAGGALKVKGIQHGPLPAWLVDACAKAGVTAVFDNRDTATPENRRPLFKAADGTNGPKGQPLAFWAPTPGGRR